MEFTKKNQPEQKVPASGRIHMAYGNTSSISLDQPNQETHVSNDVHHRNPSYSEGVNGNYHYFEQDMQYNDHGNPSVSEGVNNAVYFENLQYFQHQADFAALQNGDQNNASSSGVNGNIGYPPGIRFLPYDHELIEDYLKPKIENPLLNWDEIKDVKLYRHDPEELTASAACYPERHKPVWYFFTSRDRKYPNGTRPNRAAKNGFWKATGADHDIVREGKIIGKKKALVFFEDESPNSQENKKEKKKERKTDWIMHEYRVDDPTTSKHQSPSKRNRGEIDSDMRLDDYVLCKISKTGRSFKSQKKKGSNGDQATAMIGSSYVNPSSSNSYNSILPTSGDNVQAMDVADGMVAGIGNLQAYSEPVVNPFNYNVWNQADQKPSQMQDNFAQVDSKPKGMGDDIWGLQDNTWNMAAQQDFVCDFGGTSYGFASPMDNFDFVPSFPANDNFLALTASDQAGCTDKVSASSMDHPSPSKKK